MVGRGGQRSEWAYMHHIKLRRALGHMHLPGNRLIPPDCFRVLPRKMQGLAGGHGLGRVCDHIKEIRLLKAWGPLC